MSYYYAGLDLGQSQDYTALAIAERIEPTEDAQQGVPMGGPSHGARTHVYHVRHLERLTLGTAYPEQVTHVKRLIAQAPLTSKVTLALDYTGVGRPVLDMFRAARMLCPVYGVSIHGGDHVV